jgi:hypothetical protein
VHEEVSQDCIPGADSSRSAVARNRLQRVGGLGQLAATKLPDQGAGSYGAIQESSVGSRVGVGGGSNPEPVGGGVGGLGQLIAN